MRRCNTYNLFPGFGALVLLGWMGSDGVQGLGSLRAEEVQSFDYIGKIQPLLAKYCFDCHGEEKPKAGIRFTTLKEDPQILKEHDLWEKSLEMLAHREMPPEKKPQPSEEERQLLIDFIQFSFDQVDCSEVDPGRVTLRRLNRAEYQRTIRDLIGVSFNPQESFPQDEVGFGFDNIGDVLSTSPILLEKYLDAAQGISESAILTDYSTDPPVVRVEAEPLKTDESATADIYNLRYLGLFREGALYAPFTLTQPGTYRLSVRAFAQQAGPDKARMRVSLGERELKTFEVHAIEGKPEVYELEWTVTEPGEVVIAVAYVNNYVNNDNPDPALRGDRNLMVDYVELAGPREYVPPPLPESHRRLITVKPASRAEVRTAAETNLKPFVKRAFRRPVGEEEVVPLVDLVEMAVENGDSFELGMQLAVQAVLVSPHFLFRWELDPQPDDPSVTYQLNDYQVASRLSYFIWNSLPDDRLFEMAESGKLSEPEVLEREVRRMLSDPKSEALVQNFARQWLTIGNLDHVTPDPDRFPDWDETLRASMKRETEMFFEAVMREDRSVLEFLDADFSFLNERLARHYGIPGISGNEFQRVSFDPASPRGGVLTQASVLTITSNPTRTSPVLRGKWILEQILGAPPPPPPPNVPELEGDEKGVELTASLRQRLEQHRANPDCSVCHSKMDPLGFAFENFNAIGQWRDRDGDFQVDASGELPDGAQFNGPQELKQILKNKDTFVQCLAEKMLTYALGRGLEYFDRCTVQTISQALQSQEYRFSTLVTEIVKSDAFLKKRGEQSNL